MSTNPNPSTQQSQSKCTSYQEQAHVFDKQHSQAIKEDTHQDRQQHPNINLQKQRDSDLKLEANKEDKLQMSETSSNNIESNIFQKNITQSHTNTNDMKNTNKDETITKSIDGQQQVLRNLSEQKSQMRQQKMNSQNSQSPQFPKIQVVAINQVNDDDLDSDKFRTKVEEQNQSYQEFLKQMDISSKEECIEKIRKLKQCIQMGIKEDADEEQHKKDQKSEKKCTSYEQLIQQIKSLMVQTKAINQQSDENLKQKQKKLELLLKIKQQQQQQMRKQIECQLKQQCQRIGVSIDELENSKNKLEVKFQKKKELKKQKQTIQIRQKITQIQKIMEKLQQLKRQEFKIDIQPIRKIQIVFQTKQREVDQDTPISQIIKHFQIPQIKNTKIYLKNKHGNKLELFSNNTETLSNVFKGQNRLQICRVNFYEVINDEGVVQIFQEGTSIQDIRHKMKIRNPNFHFFANHKLYEKQRIQSNLENRLCCAPFIKIGVQIYENQLIPIKIKAQQVLKYVDKDLPKNVIISQIIPKKTSKKDKQKTMSVKYNPNLTLKQLSQNSSIEQIILTFQINAKFQINIDKQIRFQQMVFQSHIPIIDLKFMFQQKCKRRPQQQNWFIGETELNNQQTFQDIQITNQFCKIQVKQIPNIQFYGFSSIKQIDEDMYRQFYIQDDDYFIQTINSSNFPAISYEQTFRKIALRIIFSAVKKHCRVNSAIAQIKRLMKKTNKNHSLWMPKSAQQKIFFNESYALNNILTSANQQLIVDFMRINKYHSPLPIICQTSQQNRTSFENSHFWICNKAMSILSFGFTDDIYGKSSFLNRIFNTEFDIADQRHPICSKSAYIKYNIYRNQHHMVDIIDISNNCLSKKEKVQYCKYANLILLHYDPKTQIDQIEKFLNIQMINQPVILIKRDAGETKLQTKQNRIQISLQKLTKQNLRYHQNTLDQISDKINEKVIQISKNKETNKWKLCQGFIKKPQLKKYLNYIKRLEQQFVRILKFNDKQQLIYQQHPLILQLLNIRDQTQSSLLMSKIKQFSRNQRQKNLIPFENINMIESLIQKKSDDYLNKVSNQIIEKIDILLSLSTDLVTKPLMDSLMSMQNNLENKNYDPKIFVTDTLRKELNFIRQKQFSIQNFWRSLSILFDHNDADKNLIESTRNLFNRQFQSGQSFEIINGDNLKMPTKLLKSNIDRFKNKKVKTIGIFGPQSSGKSTLLNFLFGCDFMSSDGRCTNGVYGTYYDIAGRNIHNCEGLLILDTQGLFGNFTRNFKEGKNFDNKLVLFLIKVCDIMVFNTRGDIDSKSENILQLSFDSQLIDQKQTNYPNFYIVLNHGTAGQINQQQMNQIYQMRSKIISVCPQMENFMSAQQADSLQNAFITLNNNQNQVELSKIQKQDKTPTRQFYMKTKKLALSLINILERQGKNPQFQQKTLEKVYENMDNNWTTILDLPLLTRYTSRLMKKFDLQIRSWKKNTNDKIQEQIQVWKKQSPNKLAQFVKWEQRNQNQFNIFQGKILKDFDNTFQRNQDPQRNISIERERMDVEKNLDYLYKNMRLQILSRRYKLDFQQSKNRGVNIINQKAREIKRKIYMQNESQNQIDESYIQEQFEKQWINYTQTISSKIDRQKSALNLSLNVTERYNLQLTHQRRGHAIQFNKQNIEKAMINQSLQSFVEIRKQSALKSLQTNQFIQYVNKEPIILTINSGPTQLTRQYLDMSQFFQFQQSRFNLYFKTDNFGQVFNKVKKQQYVKPQMAQQVILTAFIAELNKEIRFLGFQLQQSSLINGVVQAIYKSGNNWFFSAKICSKCIIIQQYKYSQKNQQILWLQKKRKSKHNKYTYHLKQNDIHISHINLSKLVQRANYELKYANNKYMPKYCLKNGLRSYIEQICNSFIDQEYKYFKNQYDLYQNNHYRQCYKYLKLIGINFNGSNPQKFDKLDFQQNPIQIRNKEELMNLIDRQMPSIINKDKLKKKITQAASNNINIAYQIQKKIRVKKQHKDMKILEQYKNKYFSYLKEATKQKKFKGFIKAYIKKDRIFNQISKLMRQIQNQQTIKLQNLIFECIRLVNNQLDNFNKDLRQICHKLTYKFVNSVYEYANHLLWKVLQVKQWNQQEATLQQLRIQKQTQKSIFKGIISKTLKDSCSANARNLIKQYRQYLINVNNDDKRVKLEESKKKFLKQHNRKMLQQHIDKSMQMTNDIPQIFKYLTDPKSITQQYYAEFVDDYFETVNKLFESQIFKSINELLLISKKLCQPLQSQSDSWDAQDLFDNKQLLDPQNSLKLIFQKILLKGVPIVSSKQNPIHQIKQGVLFEAYGKLNDQHNCSFFETIQVDYTIPNYSVFLKSFIQQLEKLKMQLQSIKAFNDKQKQQFKEMVKLKICDAQCPCCGRLCDIDLGEGSSHDQHKCQAGHQMRAIKGIRIQKNEQGKNSLIASVMRCQDIRDSSIFKFDGKQWNWKMYKESKKQQWSFEGNKKIIQNQLFRHLWQVAGKKVCQWRQNKDNEQMIYTEYTEQTIQYLQKTQTQKHYIFAIDGSYSMEGDPWKDQLKSLKVILNDLSKSDQNLISIVVFDSNYQVFCTSKMASKIDVSTIPYPGGLTSFKQAMKGAIQCFQKDVGEKNINFVLISDGYASYPQEQIIQINKLRQRNQQKNFRLDVNTIYIGSGKSELMQKIAKQLHGQSKWVNNSSQISNAFKQIMKSSYN